MSSLAEASRALARALQESTEVKAFAAAKAKVLRDKHADKLIQEFRQQQVQLQTQQLQGKPPTQAQIQTLEQLLARMGQVPSLQEYLQAEQRLGQVIGQLNRTVLEACGVDIAPPGATTPPTASGKH